MEPMVARAFLTMQLSQKERASLWAYENRLPAGRYLQGFEICQMFRIKPKTLTEQESGAMSSLWKYYEVQALKLSQPDNQEIHEWEKYAMANYNGPLPLVELQAV